MRDDRPSRAATTRTDLAITTRWMDNDVYGHVNNVAYYSYFDTVANRYLIAEGGLDIHAGAGDRAVVESRCTYHRAARVSRAAARGPARRQARHGSVTYGIGDLPAGDDARGCARAVRARVRGSRDAQAGADARAPAHRARAPRLTGTRLARSGCMFRGVLLDVDGTLVDSNDAHAHAWVDAFAAHGLTIPYAVIRTRIGMGGDELICDLTGLPRDDPDHDAISATRAQRFHTRWLAEVRPLRGARAFLEKLRTERYPYIIASSSKADELEAILEAGGILDLCRERTSADDVDRAKPAPDIIEVALRRIALAPERPCSSATRRTTWRPRGGPASRPSV